VWCFGTSTEHDWLSTGKLGGVMDPLLLFRRGKGFSLFSNLGFV
jgi:hypothetical protein